MLKIGLTGNIACGKSLIENMLKERDIPVIDADKICHNLLDFDKITIKEVLALFAGRDIFKNDKKTLDRYKIGQIIFKDPELKQGLEEILHPQVVKNINKFFEQNKNEKIAIASVPLLYEAELDNLFDSVIVVMTDEDIQLQRLIERSGFEHEHARARINSQIPQEHKKHKADFIIDNSGSIEKTKKQLYKILLKLI